MGECETRPPDLILLLKVLLLAGGSGVVVGETVSIDATAMDAANGQTIHRIDGFRIFQFFPDLSKNPPIDLHTNEDGLSFFVGFGVRRKW